MITLKNEKENLTVEISIGTFNTRAELDAFTQGASDGYNEVKDGYEADQNGLGSLYIKGHEQGTNLLKYSRERRIFDNPPAPGTHHLQPVSQRLINHAKRVMVDLELPERGLAPEDIRPYLYGARDGFDNIQPRAELAITSDGNPNPPYCEGYEKGAQLLCEAIAAKNER
jgi:hypothetical protein